MLKLFLYDGITNLADYQQNCSKLYIFIFACLRSYKVVEDDDLKFPLVVGNGKNVSTCLL